MKKAILILCLALTTWWLIPTQSRSTLIVGTNAEFPPFTFLQEGKIVGFDIDIAKEVSKRMGREMQFKNMPFDALLLDLMLGRVDFVAAGMSVTEERATRVSFTKPYMAGDPLCIVAKLPLTLKDLEGKTVVVNEGFTADLFLTPKKDLKLVRLPTTGEAFLALKSGRADAFVTAKSTVDDFQQKQGEGQFQIQPIPGTSETCALVIAKNNSELLEKIQTALDSMGKDGTLSQIKARWKL